MAGHRALWIFVALITAGVASPAFADSGYEDDELPLRLASAFIRFTEVSAFGGETAANRWSPAVNPATADWTRVDRPLGLVVAGYGSHLDFDQGNRINLFGQTALWDTRRWGSLNVIFVQVRSNEAEDRQGLLFDYETDTVQLQWAKRVRNWSAGLSFNYAQSEVAQSLAGLRVFESKADTYRIRAGGLWSPRCSKWLIGAVAEYAWSPYDFSVVAQTPVGPIPVSDDDTQTQTIGRLAVSYAYQEYSVVYADYQVGYFENERADLTTHRVSAGVQQNLFRFLFLRLGGTIDQEGNPGLLSGLGVAFAKWGTVDLGYQYGTLPELEPNFGRAHTFQAVLSLRF